MASPTLARRVGARIRTLRVEANLTQESVAWACEIPKAHLSRIERGERMPSLAVLFQIAKEIGVEAADLLAYDLKKPRLALLDASRRAELLQIKKALRHFETND